MFICSQGVHSALQQVQAERSLTAFGVIGIQIANEKIQGQFLSLLGAADGGGLQVAQGKVGQNPAVVDEACKLLFVRELFEVALLHPKLRGSFQSAAQVFVVVAPHFFEDGILPDQSRKIPEEETVFLQIPEEEADEVDETLLVILGPSFDPSSQGIEFHLVEDVADDRLFVRIVVIQISRTYPRGLGDFVGRDFRGRRLVEELQSRLANALSGLFRLRRELGGFRFCSHEHSIVTNVRFRQICLNRNCLPLFRESFGKVGRWVGPCLENPSGFLEEGSSFDLRHRSFAS